ncbi:Uncharacterized [Moorella glycerini]|uniref:Uncharacterized protein n=1 Tax=Neomoorella stamsii TaxID=1266720 RepID=A0A9X7J6J2_9FIRM|nr:MULTISPECIES: hypothetical protein [Moorella]PRR77116.1 hypothetical protein MOST_03290 [Moorella stamsii]CEP66865.1 Uncharacterized [Moorella glycerini]
MSSWQEETVEVLILVNGCPVACLERPSGTPAVVIKGHMVEGLAVEDENELVEKVMAILQQRFDASKA